ncbi:gasdermin-C-like isoform X8 [Myotis lucifugus]|uniref:gasdermin-C-like isoform X8 n=1 Tax=Myotis lucifugus TaxID=59463 RepID=UPI000CCC795A|nr:gasdermin-C-like isoform X8 [Myotis lucifugus]
MPSMFERITKKLVKEIGDQELRPVKCLVSATKIHRFSLIRRKKARSRFWQLPDIPLDVSLMHILEPGSSVPDTAVEVSADFSDTEVRKQQAAGSVNAGAEVGFSEETAACRGSSLKYQIVSTPHETWPELQKRKLPDPEPYFLKQCREAGVNLYVVTDTVELLNSPVLQDHSSVKVSGICFIPWNIFVKGKGQGRSLQVKEKKLTVPKGSVVAYKRKQLLFYSTGWGIHHIADDNDDKETFPAGGMEPPMFRMSGMESATPRIGADFQLLQEEVSQNVKAAELSKDMQNIVFSNLLAMLGDREALQDLMDTLEQEPFGHLDGAGGTILTELQKDSCHPGVGSKCLILYLLETLMGLSEVSRAQCDELAL